MSEPLHYDKIKVAKNVSSEDLLETPDDFDSSYFVEVDLLYPDEEKEKKFGFSVVRIRFVLKIKLVQVSMR